METKKLLQKEIIYFPFHRHFLLITFFQLIKLKIDINFSPMNKQLQKPVFTKVSSLTNCRDGYNVYVKVVSANPETSKVGNQKFVKALVADQTAAANAFFKGEAADLIQKDAIIAIRNGCIKLIKNHISLEIDMFGRVTSEKVEIKPNLQNNISEQQIKSKRNREDNKPKDEKERKPREEGQKKYRQERKPKGDREKISRDNEERKPRRQDHERTRKDEGERRPRRDEGERRPRREEGERKYEDRRPRREEGERRHEGDRPRMEWTKIGAIEPGDNRLNISAKVVSLQPFKNKVKVILGDETGIVKGFFFQNEALKEGDTVVLFKAQAAVIREHIEIQLMKSGRIEKSLKREIKDVDESINISTKAWVESN